jgi:hypothetical protein
VEMSDIRWSACVVSLVLGSQTAVYAQQRGPSIRQQVHETGGLERISVTPYEPLTLAYLATSAKLVVEASITSVQSRLDETETNVFTDYTVRVRAVVNNLERSDVRVGQSITVRRESGVIVVDGRLAEVYENDFPLFKAGERYILFLTREPRDSAYTVLGGNQGAFTAGDTIVPVATTNHGIASPPPTRDKFLGEVRALLKFSVN